MNKYPLWKNLLLIFILIIAVIYAVPNFFMENPALQISSSTPGLALDKTVLQEVATVLQSSKVTYQSAGIENKSIVVQFSDTDAQLHAKTVLSKEFGGQYIIALNLQRDIPKWLISLGAHPMKLGLDLRGGVHFLLQADIDSVLKASEKSDLRNIGEELRGKKIRYAAIAPVRHGGIKIRLRKREERRR